MRFSTTFLPLATLLSVSLAAPLTTHTSLTSTNAPTWSVTNYKADCSLGGCIYTFNISTSTTTPPASSPVAEPAFHTFCQGTNVQDALVACDDPSVSANEVNGWSNYTLVVQHQWQQELEGDGGVATYWVVGNYTIVVDGAPAPAAFEVPQLEWYAVA